MRAKEIALPAVMLGLAAGYGYTQLPPAAFQSADQRARIERGDEAGCVGKSSPARSAGKGCPPIR